MSNSTTADIDSLKSYLECLVINCTSARRVHVLEFNRLITLRGIVAREMCRHYKRGLHEPSEASKGDGQ